MSSQARLPAPDEVDVWGPRGSLGPDEVVRPTGIVRIYGRAVRQAALAILLDNRSPTSISSILWRLSTRGVEVVGPQPHKQLADALRREVAKGRVVRVRRGVYLALPVPKTTAWRLWRRWTLRCWPDARWHPDRPVPKVKRRRPSFQPPEWWAPG
jgi:hypothetical protein